MRADRDDRPNSSVVYQNGGDFGQFLRVLGYIQFGTDLTLLLTGKQDKPDRPFRPKFELD